MVKTVVVIGAFDTKATEYAFLIDLIQKRGYHVIAVNTGVVGGTDLFRIDIDADEVARAADSDIDTLRSANDRGKAVAVMSDGAAVIAKLLFRREPFDAIIGMGGSAGTNVVTAAMRALPFGISKLCISTVASGDVSPYVGTSDIVMVPSLTDIAGINSLSRLILSRAAGALAGMLETTIDKGEKRPTIAVSMFGNTTPCVDRCRAMLNRNGFEVLVFHATGAGGRTLEHLVEGGVIQGVLDITTTEWADTLCGGVFDAGEQRLDAPGRAGVPHLIAPGCIDMCNFGAPDTVPTKYKGRTFYQWNPNVTLMRTTSDENRKIGDIFARKANAAKGKTAFIIPLKGFSMLDSVSAEDEQQIFWDPTADRAFVETLKATLDPSIEVLEVDANINDPVFAQRAVEVFMSMMEPALREN
ncbi:MAG: UPF0261 family protein [Luteitalea sp.]|nr:UPF0261 family protein [Luteitalea sp.]